MSSTPSIRVSQHRRLYSPPRHSPLSTTDARAATTTTGYTAAAPMAIPRAPENVPPPLPPPTFIPEIANGNDPGWQWGNDPNGSDFGRPVQLKPGSSLLGGGSGNASMMMMRSFRPEKEHDHIPTASSSSSFVNARRGSSISTIVPSRDSDMTDDGLSITNSDEDSGSSRPKSNYRLHGEIQLEQRTQELSSNSYDKHLLSRIGGPNGPHTPKRPSISFPSGSSGPQENAQLPQTENERRNCILRPLSMPERRPNVLDSPASSSRFPSSGPISPGYGGSFWPEHGPSTDSTRAQTRRGSLAFEDQASSHRSNYDQSMYNMHEDFVDNNMSNLNIHDRSPGSDDYARAGTKRRASSPPRDVNRDERSSISSASGQSDIFQRRYAQHMPARSPPAAKYYQTTPSSFSSASSYGPRHGSLGSSLGMASIPSSAATSYGSDRLSPNGLSPAREMDNKVCAPYPTAKVPAPPASNPQHQRNSSETTQPSGQSVPSAPESAQHSRNSSMSHLQGVFICDCCPKKPKKFETEGELRLHESEKQYTCMYCPNRFKNKNEAERHQNSLHLRRHSWSCVALAGVENAYHTSLSGNGTDVCGFCGEEFPNPPQWDMRADHLNTVHKFGECNQTKKFFRADHFRQHLKHSHAGTSGKWTNMLENACMREEPLPEKRVSPTAGQPTSSLAVSRS